MHGRDRFPSATPAPDDTAKAYERIRRIQDSVAAGIDFADLARRNSEDGGSAPRGGDLNWFTRRRWVRPFDDTVMTLRVGQVSGIVRTSYGYHLIKCTDRRPLKPFEEMRQEVETMYQQRRFPDDNAAFLGRLRKYKGVPPYPETRSYIAAIMRSYKKSTVTVKNPTYKVIDANGLPIEAPPGLRASTAAITTQRIGVRCFWRI